MSFLVIIAIVAFLLSVFNRLSKKDPYIQKDNDNAHLFDYSDRINQNSTINKSDLIESIKSSYELKDYEKTKSKIFNYLKYYNEDSHINFMLVISLVELNELNHAEKYASNVLYMLDNNKTGYYLLGYVEYAKGNIEKSLDYMKSSMNFGLPFSVIEKTINDENYISKLFQNEKENNIDEVDVDLPF